MRWALLLLLAGCIPDAGTTLQSRNDANELRSELNTISRTFSQVRTLAEVGCPTLQSIEVAKLACSGVKASWEPFTKLWWAAWDAVSAYEAGLISADHAIRAIRLVTRSLGSIEEAWKVATDAGMVAEDPGGPGPSSSEGGHEVLPPPTKSEAPTPGAEVTP